MKTPEQTLSDLLALGEKVPDAEIESATSAWRYYLKDGDLTNGHDAFTRVAMAGARAMLTNLNALPAIREYMEMVEGLREVERNARALVSYANQNTPLGERWAVNGGDVEALAEALSGEER
jgi:hypothetical protein